MTGLALATVTGVTHSYTSQQDAIFAKSQIKPNVIIPPALDKGSKVAILASASPTSMGEIAVTLKFLKKNGLEIEIADTIKKNKNNHRYFSAPDEERLNELNEYLNRDDINCIMFARGGYGIMRIIDGVDYDAIIAKPKVILGFSDISPLLHFITQKTGLRTFHGPVASVSLNNFSSEHIKKAIFKNPENKITINTPGAVVYNGDDVSGKLNGGNLTMICSTLGTKYEIDTKDRILFLEEVSEHPYKIDRMLTQLRLAGKLDEIKAFVFGYMKGLNYRRSFYPNRSYTIKEVIEQVLVPLGKPVVLGLPFGHVKDHFTIPVGANAEIDKSGKTMIIYGPFVN